MKKHVKFLGAFLALCLLASSLPAFAFAADGELSGKTVVLYTANVRGDIDVYAQVAALRTGYEAKGAQVVLADLGNFLQGTVYASHDRGLTVFNLMDAAGYDVVALGGAEFSFGAGTLGAAPHGTLVAYYSLSELLAGAEEAEGEGAQRAAKAPARFTAVSANVAGANPFYTFTGGMGARHTIATADGLKLGFVGLTDPATQEAALDNNVAGLSFLSGDAMLAAAKEQLAALTDCDFTICLSNAGGVTAEAAGADVVLDVPADAGLTVGAAILDNTTGAVEYVELGLADVAADEALQARIEDEKAAVSDIRTVKSEATLNGSQAAVRSEETPIGNLWADALLWFATEGDIASYYDEDEIDNGNTGLQVDANHVVALWNGGNLRDSIYAGDVCSTDIESVLPYPNRVAVLYLTGAQLLETLESATQALPYTAETADACAAFPHVAGMAYTVDIAKAYDAGEAYGDHWFTARSVHRVTVDQVHGQPFDEAATYALVTSNAVFNGMDAYYTSAMKDEELSTITTAKVTDVVWMYVNQRLGGVIGGEYAQPQGRITVQSADGQPGV